MNPGKDGMLEDQRNNGKVKNNFSLKEQVLKPNLKEISTDL
jgi:hypothetical protein